MLYLHSIYIGLRRMSTLNLIQLAQALLILPCMPIFVAWLKLGVPGALLAYIVPQALLLIPTVWYLKTKGATFTPRLDRAVVGPVLHYGVRGFVANLLDFFNYRLDSFLVNYFVGPVGAGIYSASVALAELLWQLPIAAGLVHFAKASGSDRGTLNKFTPKVFWIVFGFSLAGALGLAAVGKIAIRVIYSAAFMDAYKPLLLLLPGVVLVGSARILNNDINGRGHPIYNSITAAVALVVTIALDLILIPRMGVPGAAIASTAAYAVMFVLSVVFYLTVSRGKAPADAPRVAAGVPDA
jgi:O-antigen/teichoic acid export membrane protein